MQISTLRKLRATIKARMSDKSIKEHDEYEEALTAMLRMLDEEEDYRRKVEATIR